MARLSILAFLIAAGGCTLTRPVPADVRVPPELLRGAPYTAGGEPPRTRYVVKMTDGQRDWEIQLPEIATAYEVKVPMSGKVTGMRADLASMTAADREIMAEREASARAEQLADGDAKDSGSKKAGARGKRAAADDDDDDDDGKATKPAKGDRRARVTPASAPGSDKPPAAKASYLLTLARVKDMYRARQYELALVELVELERQYPEDEHILSMKGSLAERLGQKQMAREAWQQALRINPYNLAILEALQRLSK
jgi:tetratricopeptide (TPR) repeat protein